MPGMTSDITPVSWNFLLRATQEERAVVERVVAEHAAMGLKISMNDALLVIIRRAATPDPNSRSDAVKQIERHWRDCGHGCNRDGVKCPEGRRLRAAWGRLDFFVNLARQDAQPPAPQPIHVGAGFGFAAARKADR